MYANRTKRNENGKRLKATKRFCECVWTTVANRWLVGVGCCFSFFVSLAVCHWLRRLTRHHLTNEEYACFHYFVDIRTTKRRSKLKIVRLDYQLMPSVLHPHSPCTPQSRTESTKDEMWKCVSWEMATTKTAMHPSNNNNKKAHRERIKQ